MHDLSRHWQWLDLVSKFPNDTMKKGIEAGGLPLADVETSYNQGGALDCWIENQ